MAGNHAELENGNSHNHPIEKYKLFQDPPKIEDLAYLPALLREQMYLKLADIPNPAYFDYAIQRLWEEKPSNIEQYFFEKADNSNENIWQKLNNLTFDKIADKEEILVNDYFDNTNDIINASLKQSTLENQPEIYNFLDEKIPEDQSKTIRDILLDFTILYKLHKGITNIYHLITEKLNEDHHDNIDIKFFLNVLNNFLLFYDNKYAKLLEIQTIKNAFLDIFLFIVYEINRTAIIINYFEDDKFQEALKEEKSSNKKQSFSQQTPSLNMRLNNLHESCFFSEGFHEKQALGATIYYNYVKEKLNTTARANKERKSIGLFLTAQPSNKIDLSLYGNVIQHAYSLFHAISFSNTELINSPLLNNISPMPSTYFDDMIEAIIFCFHNLSADKIKKKIKKYSSKKNKKISTDDIDTFYDQYLGLLKKKKQFTPNFLRQYFTNSNSSMPGYEKNQRNKEIEQTLEYFLRALRVIVESNIYSNICPSPQISPLSPRQKQIPSLSQSSLSQSLDEDWLSPTPTNKSPITSPREQKLSSSSSTANNATSPRSPRTLLNNFFHSNHDENDHPFENLMKTYGLILNDFVLLATIRDNIVSTFGTLHAMLSKKALDDDDASAALTAAVDSLKATLSVFSETKLQPSHEYTLYLFNTLYNLYSYITHVLSNFIDDGQLIDNSSGNNQDERLDQMRVTQGEILFENIIDYLDLNAVKKHRASQNLSDAVTEYRVVKNKYSENQDQAINPGQAPEATSSYSTSP